MELQRRRAIQHDQLLEAMVHVTAQHGYHKTTVARVTAAASVPRSTFYEHFPRKEECLYAALADVQADALTFVGEIIDARPAEDAAFAAVQALVEFATLKPAAARLLMNETLVAGRQALKSRELGIAKLAQLIERSHRRLDRESVVPDIDPAVLIGGVQRLLTAPARQAEAGRTSLNDELHRWLCYFARPIGECHARERTDVMPAASPFVAAAALHAPPVSGQGPQRNRRTASEQQRLRIIFATAETVQRNGYLASTVAEIARCATLEPRIFYEHFADKRAALSAVHEFTFQQTMAVTAGAFFCARDWPTRIWDGGRAFTQFLARNPTLSHAALIESYAGNAARFTELAGGFTIFLQEGYDHRHGDASRAPSAIALEAITAVNFEALHRQAHRRRQLPLLLPRLAYMSLAPFRGASVAAARVEAIINAEL